jgi:3-methyladenine DNA glycosylase AlkD
LTLEEISSELRQSGEPQRLAALGRLGGTAPAFSVGLPALRSLAKRIGHDHELALVLWQTPVREARILASLIDERERVTEDQMDRWTETFDGWEICDSCCPNLFAHTPFTLAKAVEWTLRPEEFVKRAAFVLVAVCAATTNARATKPSSGCCRRSSQRPANERPSVRKGASWALRQIGKRNDRLRTLSGCRHTVHRQRQPRRPLGRPRRIAADSAEQMQAALAAAPFPEAGPAWSLT